MLRCVVHCGPVLQAANNSKIITAIYAIVVWRKNQVFRDLHKQLPCSLKSVPVLGHAKSLMGDSEDLMSKVRQLGQDAIANDGLASFWLGNKLFVVISDPVAADFVMKNCLEKDDIVNPLRSLIGNGSIFAPVPIWRPRRKVLAPTFGQKTLNSFVKIFVNQSKVMTDQVKSEVGKDKFSIFTHMGGYTVNSVCESTLGVKMNAHKDPNHPVLKSFQEFSRVYVNRVMRPWMWPDAIFKWSSEYPAFVNSANVLINCFDQIIKEKRQEMEQKQNNAESKNNFGEKSQTKSFVEHLMESTVNGKGCSDLELREETSVMVIAGSDTSALALSFMSILLARYPDVQEKVYKEIQEVLGDTDRPIEPEDLPKLKYLDAVVRESLRMYPPAPILTRKVDKNVTLPSGITLVPGVHIWINAWGVQRNPKYWGPDVDVFRPERFFDSPPTHPACFLPFSYGPRMCLGYQYAMMSMKTALGSLVRRYRLLPRIDPNEDQSRWQDKKYPIRTKVALMMRDVNDFEMRVEDRN